MRKAEAKWRYPYVCNCIHLVLSLLVLGGYPALKTTKDADLSLLTTVAPSTSRALAVWYGREDKSAPRRQL